MRKRFGIFGRRWIKYSILLLHSLILLALSSQYIATKKPSVNFTEGFSHYTLLYFTNTSLTHLPCQASPKVNLNRCVQNDRMLPSVYRLGGEDQAS